MKQLKFMLAAATAIGLATAAQAETQIVNQPVDSEDFESYTTATTFADLEEAGFSYDGDTAADNESAIVAGGATTAGYALQVNTGTDPILRKLDTENDRAINLAADKVKNVYIDTMVQFTVTPAGDTVKKDDDDKLMIYLAEATNETGVVTGTNLVVRAGYKGAEALTWDDYVLDTGSVSVVPGAWYHLKVKAYANVNLAGVGMDVYPAFEIYINETLVRIANSGCTVDLNEDANIFFFDGGYSDQLLAGTMLLSMKANDATLDFVGFAGEGKVDDIAITKDVEQDTVLDFTFTITLDAGVSSVTYTIGNDTPVTIETGTEVSGIAKDSTVVVTATAKDWYKIASGTGTYTATADTPIAVTSTPTATADGNGITVPATTAPADLGITSGSAFYAAEASEAAAAELSKALTWAMSKGGATTAAAAAGVVNGLAFDGEEETDAEKAYLLDCTEAQLSGEDGEIAKFKFAGFDPATGTFKVGAEKQVGDKAAYGNGYVEVRGSATVGGAYNEAADKSKHSFFKAFLVPFQPAAVDAE